MRRTHRLVPITAAVMVAALGSLTIAAPASAECPEAPWYPPVTKAIRSAREVIVGKVLAADGSGSFRLRIDYVLRGPARVGAVRTFTKLRPNWPDSLCTFLNPSVDNTIAIAFDALHRDGRTRYNAASWVHGMPEWMIDVERVTLDELFALGALPPTDSLSVDATGAAAAPHVGRALFLLIMFVISAISVMWRLDRRGR
jgi:hypothetical protein